MQSELAPLWHQFGTAGVMVGMLVGALRWMAGRWEKDRERAEQRYEKTTDQLTGILRENTVAQTETAAAMRELRQTVGALPCKQCPADYVPGPTRLKTAA